MQQSNFTYFLFSKGEWHVPSSAHLRESQRGKAKTIIFCCLDEEENTTSIILFPLPIPYDFLIFHSYIHNHLIVYVSFIVSQLKSFCESRQGINYK